MSLLFSFFSFESKTKQTTKCTLNTYTAYHRSFSWIEGEKMKRKKLHENIPSELTELVL